MMIARIRALMVDLSSLTIWAIRGLKIGKRYYLNACVPIFKRQLFRTCFIAKIAQAAKIKGILISLKTHIRKIARYVDL